MRIQLARGGVGGRGAGDVGPGHDRPHPATAHPAQHPLRQRDLAAPEPEHHHRAGLGRRGPHGRHLGHAAAPARAQLRLRASGDPGAVQPLCWPEEHALRAH